VTVGSAGPVNSLPALTLMHTAAGGSVPSGCCLRWAGRGEGASFADLGMFGVPTRNIHRTSGLRTFVGSALGALIAL